MGPFCWWATLAGERARRDTHQTFTQWVTMMVKPSAGSVFMVGRKLPFQAKGLTNHLKLIRVWVEREIARASLTWQYRLTRVAFSLYMTCHFGSILVYQGLWRRNARPVTIHSCSLCVCVCMSFHTTFIHLCLLSITQSLLLGEFCRLGNNRILECQQPTMPYIALCFKQYLKSLPYASQTPYKHPK